MKTHERIRSIRESKGLKLMEVYNRIKEHFGPRKKIHYRTLQRIEAGDTEPAEFSLYRISFGLGIKLSELRGEEENIPAKFIPKDKIQGHYAYPHTKLKGLLPQRLDLAPKAKTPIEKNIDPLGEKIYEKWVFGLKGEITCTVEGEKYLITKGDVLFFEGHNSHYFENNSSKKAYCLVIYCPPYP